MAHDGVVLVLLVKVMGLERVVDQVRPFHVAGRVKALDARQLLGLVNALIGQMAGVLFFLDLVIEIRRILLKLRQTNCDIVRLAIAAQIAERRARDNERRACLVDENVVDFIDDGEMQRLLALLGPGRVNRIAPACGLHVVAKIIEAKLAIGPIGNVAIVSPAPRRAGPYRSE